MSAKLTCLYIRVSTLDQVGGAESQTRALLEWCQKNDITNYEIFADHGISGAKENRPALNRLMERVASNDCEQVVCFAFSRMARSTTHLLKVLEFCKRHSTRFWSITEALDTNSPMGICLFTLTGESIPAKNLTGEITFGVTFDPSYSGPMRLVAPDGP